MASSGRRAARDGRMHLPLVEARARPLADGRVELRSPGVGQFRGTALPGDLVTHGMPVGDLDVLGSVQEVIAPAGARGLVVGDVGPSRPARRAVGWDDPLLVLDPQAADHAVASDAAAEADEEARGLVFVAPSSGRFYGRPSPEEPPFVAVGDVLTAGRTIALLEVMKTFNRVAYGGPGLPERARVLRVVPADESDLEAGEAILELEPA